MRSLDDKQVARYRDALDRTLDYSRARGYGGHNKHDGLNSPLLSTVLGFARWPRIVAIQFVMRSPWNLRSLLGVPRTRNAKGQALFAQAWLDRFAAGYGADCREQAQGLLDWLLDHPSTGFRGLSWGYPYPWQDVGFFAPTYFPNRVVTCWIGFAFAEAARLTGEPRYVEALPRIADFLLGEPNRVIDNDDHLCLTYVPDREVGVAVIDVPALCGAFLAECAEILDRPDLLDSARRLMAWVADKQTEYGAWFYTHPPSDSFITHDNYHTAIILDCFDRYARASGDPTFDEAYRQGLRFYRDHHFTSEGAPRWMHDGQNATDLPFDIHGSASAVLCFTRASRSDESYWPLALRTLDWTLDNMYHPEGRFYYQKTRFGTKRFCLLRWCNGWMSWALSQVLREGTTEQEDPAIFEGAS
ncbi:MAG: hypothetical protein MPN21_21270 [Thermoanaerobaculia bacterium]|nr:hypothetical protein [Thermoanaerobaculia bacterium]